MWDFERDSVGKGGVLFFLALNVLCLLWCMHRLLPLRGSAWASRPTGCGTDSPGNGDENGKFCTGRRGRRPLRNQYVVQQKGGSNEPPFFVRRFGEIAGRRGLYSPVR